jgi:replication factor C large subunit
MWSEKHRPQNISDMIGNEEARTAFVEWFAKWKKGTKPILLVGPPGIGKTTISNLAGKQFGYDMISLNASDVRTKSRITQVLTPVLGNITVLGRPMIFVDEVDGIHGRADFGGAEALIKILKEPTIPIVLGANSDTSDKMKSIKKVVKTIYFRPLPPRLLRLCLENILKREGAKLSPGSLIKIINESRGDIRSMINSAQAHVTGFNPPTERSFETLDVEAGVNAFFKANSIDEARSVIYSMSINPREKINAFYSTIITSNLSIEESGEMLEVLSEADMLYGKIMKTQEWRLLRYLDEILLGLYKKDTSIRYSRYNLSWPLLNRLRWDGRTIKALVSALAKNMHVSKSTFATFYFPYILFMIKNKQLDLELEENYSEIIEKEIERLK